MDGVRTNYLKIFNYYKFQSIVLGQFVEKFETVTKRNCNATTIFEISYSEWQTHDIVRNVSNAKINVSYELETLRSTVSLRTAQK